MTDLSDLLKNVSLSDLMENSSMLRNLRRDSDSQFTGEILLALLAKLVAKEILTVDDGLDVMLSPVGGGSRMGLQIREMLRPEVVRMKEAEIERKKANAKETEKAESK